MMLKKIPKIYIIFIILSLQEILFSCFVFNCAGNIILKISFCALYTIVIDIISSFGNEKTNKRLFITLMTLINLIFITYFITYSLLENIISINTIINGTSQAHSFSDILLKELASKWYQILLLLLPNIIAIVLAYKMKFERIRKKAVTIKLCSAIILYLLIIVLINCVYPKDTIYSMQNVYYNINNSSESVKDFGLLTTVRLDLQRTIVGFKEKALIEHKNKNGQIEIIDKNDYNMQNIDFEKIKEESNEEVKETAEYLQSQNPSNKNEYTGIYSGKNLVVFVCESFSNLAIREDLTPTLYKMANSGFQFHNFYTPLFPVSTADGEYMTDTSLLPANNVWSIEKVKGKTYPFSYANELKNDGYKTFAYHNHDFNYYKRNDYFPVMGYDTYLGKGNGLEKRMDFSSKPASDYEMVKTTVDDYINEDHFVAYYMTMSGHMNYDKENAMVVKNWDKVKDLEYSDKVKAYLATQIELDKALEELITRLREANKLEDTVIIMTGDHYPYGLTFQEMNELSDKDMNNPYNRYNMPFIIMNGENEKDVIIDKYCSSLDVLPTMLNLFGIEYDSRLLMGRDIFSDAESLVIFGDRSFITNKGFYDSMSESFTSFDDNIQEKEYIKEIQEDIYHKFRYSRLMLENDFYRYLINN